MQFFYVNVVWPEVLPFKVTGHSPWFSSLHLTDPKSVCFHLGKLYQWISHYEILFNRPLHHRSASRFGLCLGSILLVSALKLTLVPSWALLPYCSWFQLLYFMKKGESMSMFLDCEWGKCDISPAFTWYEMVCSHPIVWSLVRSCLKALII